jgi:hypothetical protein
MIIIALVRVRCPTLNIPDGACLDDGTGAGITEVNLRRNWSAIVCDYVRSVRLESVARWTLRRPSRSYRRLTPSGSS